MIKCANENCDKNPDHSIDMMIVNVDGDMACDKKCKSAYEKQHSKFLGEIIHDDNKFKKWMLGL